MDSKIGSDCGSVGKAVTCNNGGPQFESSHHQNLYSKFAYCQLHWKDKNVEKEAVNGPFLKKKLFMKAEPDPNAIHKNLSPLIYAMLVL